MVQAVNTARRNLLRGRPASTPAPVRPPRALPESGFLETCTRCDECVRACPEGIIVRGSGGLPEVNFRLGQCTFCEACVEACPEDALQMAIEPPWTLQLNLGNSCLALKQVVCQTCGDVCDQRAISFPARQGGVAAPLIDHEACTACGACVGACPSSALGLSREGTHA